MSAENVNSNLLLVLLFVLRKTILYAEIPVRDCFPQPAQVAVVHGA